MCIIKFIGDEKKCPLGYPVDLFVPEKLFTRVGFNTKHLQNSTVTFAWLMQERQMVENSGGDVY